MDESETRARFEALETAFIRLLEHIVRADPERHCIILPRLRGSLMQDRQVAQGQAGFTEGAAAAHWLNRATAIEALEEKLIMVGDDWVPPDP